MRYGLIAAAFVVGLIVHTGSAARAAQVEELDIVARVGP